MILLLQLLRGPSSQNADDRQRPHPDPWREFRLRSNRRRFVPSCLHFLSLLSSPNTQSALDLPLVGIGRMVTLVIRGVLGVVNRIMPALSYNFHSSKPCASPLICVFLALALITNHMRVPATFVSLPTCLSQLRAWPYDGCSSGHPHSAVFSR
jgi:hypothetical protein